MTKDIQITVAITFKMLNEAGNKSTGYETFESSYLKMDEDIDVKLKQLNKCFDKFNVSTISYCLGNVADNVAEYISNCLHNAKAPDLQAALSMKRYTAVGNLALSQDSAEDIYERCLTGYGKTLLVTRLDELGANSMTEFFWEDGE